MGAMSQLATDRDTIRSMENQRTGPRLDPDVIRQQIGNLLAQFPELAEDEQLRADSIEGETDAFEFLASLIRRIEDAKALSEGVQGRIQELTERASRFDRRQDAFRSLAFKIMQAADLQKAELPCATLLVRNVPPKVIVTDETRLPDILCKITRAPDKKRIKELLDVGEAVPGCELSNGDTSLTIRVK